MLRKRGISTPRISSLLKEEGLALLGYHRANFVSGKSLLIKVIDKISIDEIGAKQLIEKEVARYNKLQSAMNRKKEKIDAREMDVRQYAKYLLKEGTKEERRELLIHPRNRIVLKGRGIEIA